MRVDVLIKRGKVFEVIEVKAKSYSGDVSERVKSIGGQLRLYTNVPRGAAVEMSFDVWD